MAHWYTADTHFGHENIIKLCGRPFHSINEMDAKLSASLSGPVLPDDDLWIIGDFAFGSVAKDPSYLKKIFSRLNGRKHLIIGNHDSALTQDLPWDSVNTMVEIEDEGQPLTLCHYPMMTFNKARKGALQLFGHVHGSWRGSRNTVNVGVDVWDYRPVQLHDIIKRAKTQKPHQHWEDVEPRAGV